MKKFIYSFVLFCGTLALVLSGCKGDTGPAGADGTDGVDGNEVCLQCHSLAVKNLITGMYNLSVHAAGATAARGSAIGCGKCHCDQGFIETVYTGQDTLAETLLNPQPIQCGTCHDFHTTFDPAEGGPDPAIRTTAPVDLIAYPTKTMLDLGDNSNLCANCHQPRTPAPVDDGTGQWAITSTHWGPHHGPQATMLDGIGLYEVAGTAPYPTSKSTHRTAASCVKCHMHEVAGNVTEGGHTWWPVLEACTPCHAGATDFNINGKQTQIEGLLEDLKTAMINAGMYDAGADHVITGTYPIDQAGAFFNFAAIEDDKSLGVHNPAYIYAILVNSIAVF